MATTHVPPLGPVQPDLDLNEALEDIHEMLQEMQGDEDKAGTVEDNVFYEGCVWGLKYALAQLTVTEEKK